MRQKLFLTILFLSIGFLLSQKTYSQGAVYPLVYDVCETTTPIELTWSGTGTVDHWERGSGGSWTNIGGGGGVGTESISEPTPTSGEYQYRTYVNLGGGNFAYSVSSTLTVYAETFAGATVSMAFDAALKCESDNTGTVQVDLSNATGEVTHWVYSYTGDAPWFDLGESEPTFTYDDLEQTTYYKAVIKNGACAAKVTDNVATISVLADPIGGTATIDNDELCVGTTTTLRTANYSGTSVQWQLLDGSWGDIGSGATYTIVPNPAANFYKYRAKAIQSCKDGTNGNITKEGYSNEVELEVYQTTAAVDPIGSNVVAYDDGTVNSISVVPSNGSVVRWEYSPDDSQWTPLSVASNTLTYHNLTESTFYRAVVQNGVCEEEASNNSVKITVANAGELSSTGTDFCSSPANSGTLTVSEHEGTTWAWQSAVSPFTSWSNLASDVNTLAFNNLTETTHYRINMNAGKDYSDPIIINVSTPSVSGSLTPNFAGAPTVCYDNADSRDILLTGNMGNVIRWESSTNNGAPWTNIENTTSTLSFNNLLETTYYRAVIENGVCPEINTTSQVIEIAEGGEVTSNTDVCESDPINRTVSLSNYNGVIDYWEKQEFSTVWGAWSFEANAGNTDYVYSNLTRTTRFRAIIKSACSGDVQSDYAEITVFPVSVGGTTSGDKTVRPNDNAGSVIVSGITGNVVRWEYSYTNKEPWASIENTTTTLSYENIERTTYYRAIIQNGPCGESISTVATITVANQGSISENTAVCASDATTRTLNLENHLGIISRWQFSLDQITWFDIAGTSGQVTYDYSNLTQTRSYRAVITEDGDDIFSEYATVTVNPLPNPDFTANQACFSHESEFTNTSTIATGSIKYVEWDFTDGTSSAAYNPNHVFPESGDYLVSLKLMSDKLCENTIVKTLTVKPLPTVDFGLTEQCDQTAIPFVNNSSLPAYTLTYAWDFGDGLDDNAPSPNHTYATFGEYEVKLIVTANGDCQDSLTRVLTVHENPVPNFTFENVCDGDKMEFVNTSFISDGNMQYSWNFDDLGANSTETSPKYKFSASNTYDIELEASTAFGCSVSKIKTVQVYHEPVANFTATENCFGTTTSLTDASTIGGAGTLLWNWDFKDGNVSTTQNPSHTYGSSDSYIVELKITSDNGCIDRVEKEVLVHPIPNPNFIFNNDCDGNAVQFSNFTNISGGTMTYAWDFGDLSATNTDKEPLYTFGTHGNYDVELTATSNENCVSKLTKTIAIYPRPDVDYSAANVCDEKPVIFNDNSTIISGTIDEYYWDFGDGYTSLLENPEYTYTHFGTYTVYLTAISDKNCTSTTQRDIEVLKNPIPNFTQVDVCEDYVMTFTDVSTEIEGIPSYAWNFGDAIGNSTEQNPTYTYVENGNFDVELQLTSGNGCVKTFTKEVEVFLQAIPDFTFSAACENNEVQFTNTSSLTSGAMSFAWDFGNAQTSNNTDPTSIYANWGSYAVSLNVTTDRGCQSNMVKNIAINQNPIVNFYVENICYGFPSDFDNLSTVNVGDLTYEWNFGDKNTSSDAEPNYAYGSPGIYEVYLTATSEFGCSSVISDFTEIYPTPYASFNSDPICVGNMVVFDNVSDIEAGTMTYDWTFGNGDSSNDENPSVTYTAAGDFDIKLVAISNNSCTDEITKNLSVYYGPTSSFENTTVCDGYPTTFTNQSTIGSGSIVYYQWDFGDLNNSLQENPVHQYFDAGTYTVSLLTESDKGCKNIETKEVIVDFVPIANFSTDPVCFKEPMYFNDETYFPDFAPGTLAYEWTMGDYNQYNVDEPIHIYGKSGIFIVTQKVISSIGGCENSMSRQVLVYDLPIVYAGKDTIVPKGFPLIMGATASPGNYVWTPGDELDNPYIVNPLLKPSKSNEYVLEVTDSYNCVNTDTVNVLVDESFELYRIDYSASNIITPDGNGRNDAWEVPNITFYEVNHVHIYDRWGNEVFAVTNYQNDWKGTNQGGDNLPDGTYYYVIYFDDSDTVLKGAITLLRNP